MICLPCHISNNGKVKTMIYFCLKLLFCVLKLFLEADGQDGSELKFKNAGSTFSNDWLKQNGPN